jgi:hypothetical protein
LKGVTALISHGPPLKTYGDPGVGTETISGDSRMVHPLSSGIIAASASGVIAVSPMARIERMGSSRQGFISLRGELTGDAKSIPRFEENFVTRLLERYNHVVFRSVAKKIFHSPS